MNKKWIEPLLGRIKENRSNVAVPVIDIINADTFTYTSSPLVRGGFTWGLYFKWDNLPKGKLCQIAQYERISNILIMYFHNNIVCIFCNYLLKVV